ncbi:MAG: MarR family transcriptional regulator [Planctomycetota bacterium]|nr:MarR family transcriptional regulator [Planctomycetota bacterium]
MLEFDFENGIGFWICAASHALRRDMNAELAREGITFRQWEVLACVALGMTTQTEIAERLGIEAPTLVGVLERMERDGWLERVNSTQDRRKKNILVTQKAEDVWTRMVECAHRVRSRARAGLSDDELNTLRELCGRIQHNLSHEHAEGAAAAAVCQAVSELIDGLKQAPPVLQN